MGRQKHKEKELRLSFKVAAGSVPLGTVWVGGERYYLRIWKGYQL